MLLVEFFSSVRVFEFHFLIFCEEKGTSYFSLKECGVYVTPRNPFSKYGLDKFVELDPGVS